MACSILSTSVFQFFAYDPKKWPFMRVFAGFLSSKMPAIQPGIAYFRPKVVQKADNFILTTIFTIKIGIFQWYSRAILESKSRHPRGWRLMTHRFCTNCWFFRAKS